MAIIFIVLLLIILLSKTVEQTLKIPPTLTILVAAFALHRFAPDLIAISPAQFDEILYLMLPVILLPDILNLSIREMRRNAWEIFYLAVVAVGLSIIVASALSPLAPLGVELDVYMYLTLFTMLMATDAITVTTMMNRLALPERLKVYAESESLFNDVTALIVFYFIALPTIAPQGYGNLSLEVTLAKVLLLSVAIGVGISFLGYMMVKVIKEPIEQFIIIYLMVVSSFLIAEHFRIAGILAIVATVLGFKYFVQKEMFKPARALQNERGGLPERIRHLLTHVPALTSREFREYRKEAAFIGIFANAVVFVMLAHMFEPDLLMRYAPEIALVFALTTLLRFGAIAAFTAVKRLPFRWTGALTYSGMKGALAVIMLHSLPESFEHKELFKAVVIGNIILSTFLYTPLLAWHIRRNEDAYRNDALSDREPGDAPADLAGEIRTILQTDEATGAMTPLFTEQVVDDELSRSRRYKNELAFVLIEPVRTPDADTLRALGETVRQMIRDNDHFGMRGPASYLIVATHTSLSGAVILCDRLDARLKEHLGGESAFCFGVTEFAETDEKEEVYEKLSDALEKARANRDEPIETSI